MTENEQRVLEESKKTIKEEKDKIVLSVTRILMIGGPTMVKAILASLGEVNDQIMKDLKLDVSIEFQGEEE